jgi:hypothetical protein
MVVFLPLLNIFPQVCSLLAQPGNFLLVSLPEVVPGHCFFNFFQLLFLFIQVKDDLLDYGVGL